MDTSNGTGEDPAAILKEWRKAEQAATPGPLEAVTDDHGRGHLDHSVWSDRAGYYLAETVRTRDDAEFIVTARTAMPALLAAAEAALAFHEESDGTCGSCLDAYGDRIEWPCEEYRAITAALAGKDGNDE